MVYSIEAPLRDLWTVSQVPDSAWGAMLNRLARLSQAYGLVRWDPLAAKQVNDWHMGGGRPQPTHSKLGDYLRSRTVNLIKLSTLCAISRDEQEKCIRECDVTRALGLMLDAERRMPDIFRAMIGRSDSQVLEELHLFVTALWAKAPGSAKHVQKGPIMRFLLQRVPTDKAEKILESAVSANILGRLAGTEMYVPRAKTEWETE